MYYMMARNCTTIVYSIKTLRFHNTHETNSGGDNLAKPFIYFWL